MLPLCKFFLCFFFFLGTLEDSPLPVQRGSSEQAASILDQPFHFLAKGGQTTVYASQDGKYVLKLFNNVPKNYIPFSGYKNRKLKKLRRDMAAYLLAFDRLQHESALVFLHFDVKTSPLFPTAIDGRKVVLEKTPFILQKKGSSLENAALSKEALVDAVQKLIDKRAAAGVGDDDPRLYQNIGMLEGDLFFLDPGRFVQDPEKKTALPDKFLQWLKD